MELDSSRNSQSQISLSPALLILRPIFSVQLLDYQVQERGQPVMIRTTLCRKFTGGCSSTLLTKSKVYHHPNDLNSAIVCSGDEDEKGVLIWQKEDDEPIQRLKCNAIVLDVAMMKIASPPGTLLAVLTENDLFLYSWTL